MSGYAYYRGAEQPESRARLLKRRLLAHSLSRERFHPNLGEPDYLILKRRKSILQQFVDTIPDTALTVLDVGGRIQPYRELLRGRQVFYVAVDPQFDGLVDVVSFGEELPIATAAVDLVLCTQVLTYARDPEALVDEIFRVLKPGGVLLLTVPAFFPRHHDERWRFLPEGIELLLSDWKDVEVIPEGHSVTGLLRTFNVCFNSVASDRLRRVFQRTLIPLLNLIGEIGEGFHPKGTMLTANYATMARKPEESQDVMSSVSRVSGPEPGLLTSPQAPGPGRPAP